jgi:hypothetical protein
MDPQRGANGTPIAKSATVFIPTANYKEIRAILSGQPIPVTISQPAVVPTNLQMLLEISESMPILRVPVA